MGKMPNGPGRCVTLRHLSRWMDLSSVLILLIARKGKEIPWIRISDWKAHSLCRTVWQIQTPSNNSDQFGRGAMKPSDTCVEPAEPSVILDVPSTLTQWKAFLVSRISRHRNKAGRFHNESLLCLRSFINILTSSTPYSPISLAFVSHKTPLFPRARSYSLVRTVIP